MTPQNIDNLIGATTRSGLAHQCPDEENADRIAALEARVDELTAVVRYLVDPGAAHIPAISYASANGVVVSYDDTPCEYDKQRHVVARMLNEWLDATEART